MDCSGFEHSENEKRSGSPTPNSLRVVRLVIKGLSVALIILLLPFVTRHCLPLLKPVGKSIVQRLWDVLRFIVVTTVVSFGILNSQWKAIERVDPLTEEDDRHRRAPLLNNSIINEMEHKSSKESFASDFPEESPRIVRHVLPVSGNAGVGRIQDEANRMERLEVAPVEEVQTNVHVNIATASKSLESTVTFDGNTLTVYEGDADLPNRNAAEAATVESTTDSRAGRLSGESYSRGLAMSPISEGISAVAKTNFKSTCVSKERPILHRRVASPHSWNHEKSRRRSSSVDVPAQRQSSRVPTSGDADNSRVDLDPSVKMDVQPKAISNLVMRSGHSRSNSNVDRLNENTKPARSSRRHASFSCDFGDGALNLDQLNENEKSARASRRYASFSYDFGDDYSPEWLIEHVPPPPLTDPSDSEMEASSPTDRTMCATPLSLVSHGRSSPVDISPRTNSCDSHPPQAALVEELPSTSVSPSPSELNRKADAFIARFYEKMRLDRVDSFERRRSNIRSARRGYKY